MTETRQYLPSSCSVCGARDTGPSASWGASSRVRAAAIKWIEGALREDRKGGEARSQRHDLHLVCGWADRTFRKHAGIREATPSARNPLRSYTLQSNTYLVDHTFIHVFNIIPFRTIERLSRCNKRLAGNAPLNGEWLEILRRNRERDGKYNWSQAWINVD